MPSVNIETLCESISTSIANVRIFSRSPAHISEILDSVWSIQDYLGRLVDAASDRPVEVFRLLKSEHPELLQDIGGVLGTVSNGSLARNAAIAASFATVTGLLRKLEVLRPLSRSNTVGA
ncbi:MAG: hypothetical protein JO033_24420 [Acidobacteriaceae bacterium]|nr:hypothetical protein [Acidobacteriaceae bacterium]